MAEPAPRPGRGAAPLAGQTGLCRDCPIGCHIKKGGKKKNKPAAYAALWCLDRSSPGFDEFVAAYHRLCDDIGLEAFETAAALAVGLKAGLVKSGFSGILAAVEEISRGSELGLILGNGAESAALIWGVTSDAAAGPRKTSGRSETEDIFLDSMGLCAFAYSALPADSSLWQALEELLKAKYGPGFDIEKLKNLAREARKVEKP